MLGVCRNACSRDTSSFPVCFHFLVSLVNDVDDEKGPAYFTYSSTLRYDKPFDLLVPSSGCACHGGCQAGDANCPCVQRNGGFLPYNSLGVVLNYKALIHECGPSY
ncbi:hypothetical protein POM88_030258 [Heracleum sosnowskyi]|uniref:Pre-SET domain-containing protein n=1 Tax=Heracleum sosnowskyi TaxID=360622 RepID=A0AAD8HY84_9APIA|nr:hypothetical protein POM88_030258 [Heracleum sosnowskyi]